MKKIIILSTLLLAFFFASRAQSKRDSYQKRYKTTHIPLTKPLDNKVVIKNDTIVFPRNDKPVFLVYKLFYNTNTNAQFRKGIVVMGSGNDAQNPSEGRLDGQSENALCNMAVQDGYIAAIVQYTKGPGTADWNASAQQFAEDYDACISSLAVKFKIPKSKSVAGGVSYAGYMLLSANGYSTTLNYCKGILAPCSATGTDAASKFKIPVYNICCSNGYENAYGNVTGSTLYNAINGAAKNNSECVIDNSCNTHCGNLWTNQLFTKMKFWLQ